METACETRKLLVLASYLGYRGSALSAKLGWSSSKLICTSRLDDDTYLH